MSILLVAISILGNATLMADEPKGDFIKHEQRSIEGWPVQVDVALLSGDGAERGDKALKILSHHLYRISQVLPEERVKQMQKVTIYLDDNHELGALQYHPNAGWLRDHNYDPAMEKCVHVPKSKSLINHFRDNHQPWVMLHEMAHAWHDQTIGFDDERVIKAYERAKQSGMYEEVLHIRGHKTKHYALTNHKEYFAELTESYFGTNDFFPFVRGELKDADPDSLEMLQEVWGKSR